MMKPAAKPIGSTIAWGLMGAIFYIPLSKAFIIFMPWTMSFQLTIWVLLSGYTFLMSGWSSEPFRRIRFPLLLLLCAAILVKSTTAFLFTGLVIFSWIRSGICFKEQLVVKRLGAEIGLGLGTGLLVFGATPDATIAWALGVWMFFLIHALYFVLFEYRKDPEIELDPFERAKMAAEKILSEAIF
jgi:hypothetical protein